MLVPLEGAFDIVYRRHSVRTYDRNRSVKEEPIARLEECMREHPTGPFGNPVRFRLLNLDGLNAGEGSGLGTYGVIRGARLFLLAAVPESQGSMEDLGFCMERVVLEATALGLGTCWLAGTFRRAAFARQMQLQEGELLPAVTPVGYPAGHKRLLEKVMETGARARQRKPWRELFFSSDGKTALGEAGAGAYRDALEAVRLAPSASNKQPWRLVADDKAFHLYLAENRRYNQALAPIYLQNIDMGIAMCHFQLVAQEQGLTGAWRVQDHASNLPPWEYIASWDLNG